MTDNHALFVAEPKLSLAAGQLIVDAGVKAAQAVGVPMSIVTVDRGGHVKAVAHMDGATPLPYEVAYRKAWTAATTGAATADVHAFISATDGGVLSMPHLPGFSVVPGGLPIMVDGRCVGAVGVSGATAELDLQIAVAALAAIEG